MWRCFRLLLAFLILVTSSTSFPLFNGSSLTSKEVEDTTPVVVIHHRHRKVRAGFLMVCEDVHLIGTMLSAPLSPQASTTKFGVKRGGEGQTPKAFTSHEALLALALKRSAPENTDITSSCQRFFPCFLSRIGMAASPEQKEDQSIGHCRTCSF
ncbi:hypothetical protein Q1695_009546 [Nippostrongylus brasiliensis]|nr:hypothetical protein Q1695_009546 [Nippostrongylus brasiliensis]